MCIRDSLLSISAFVLMFFDERLDAKDSLILIVLLIVCVYYFQPPEDKELADNKGSSSLSNIIFYLLLSLGMLIFGSTYFINGATQIATALGVSAYVIGLTLAALGTSLPELAASIQSARKGKFDFIVGNIIGSNLFNISIAMSIAGIISSSHIESDALVRDILMLGLSTLVLYLIIQSNSMFRTVYSVALVITYFLYLTLILK